MAEIHPKAVVEESVELADDVRIDANCYVGERVRIGSGCVLYPNVTIGSDTKIGNNNEFFPNCSVGGRPQVLGVNDESDYGTLEIGDNNTVREQVTIHPSMYPEEKTVIGNNNFLMIGVHIGHDCVLEDYIVMSNFSQISGHCKIEKGVWFSGMVAVHQFITIGKWSYAAAMTGINHDVPPFVIISGHYPPRVRGVNKRGLKRAGLDEGQQKAVFEGFKKLYRESGQPLLEKAKELADDGGVDENVKLMAQAIIRSSEHRYGRYLEIFRH